MANAGYRRKERQLRAAERAKSAEEAQLVATDETEGDRTSVCVHNLNTLSEVFARIDEVGQIHSRRRLDEMMSNHLAPTTEA